MTSLDHLGPIGPELPTLPRKVATNSVWPARTIVAITDHQYCTHCREAIAYYRDDCLRGEWVHTATELTRCEHEAFTLAGPTPRCHVCKSVNVVHGQTNWGNTFDCLGCGRHEYYSIGD
ncbi:MAG: hypothetical protein JWO67_3833 [Streptosporangiaceae bacterium]|nr:hypothetical protein [Streptosporangiaceae bacterium]